MRIFSSLPKNCYYNHFYLIACLFYNKRDFSSFSTVFKFFIQHFICHLFYLTFQNQKSELDFDNAK